MKDAKKVKKEESKTTDTPPIKYFEEAVVTCSCGVAHKVGSTQESGTVEVCSACHPFYTGTQKFIDSAGRLEKFKARVQASQDLKKKTKNKK